jgi:hypothetical protein
VIAIRGEPGGRFQRRNPSNDTLGPFLQPIAKRVVGRLAEEMLFLGVHDRRGQFWVVAPVSQGKAAHVDARLVQASRSLRHQMHSVGAAYDMVVQRRVDACGA